MRLSSRCSEVAVLAGFALACSAPTDSGAPRVVSLTREGTRALGALELSHLLVAADSASQEHLAIPVPTTTLNAALSYRPDLVLVPPTAPESEPTLEAIRISGAWVLEVAPHQFADAFTLYREIARALGDEARGRTTAHRIGDPLARMSARNLGKRRPLVAALVSLDPLVLAGGHSFVSDLVETAGAETLTHGDEVARVPGRVDEIRTAAPELVLVATPALPSETQQTVVRGWFEPVSVAFLPIVTDDLWLAGSLDAAIALQDLVDALRSEDDRVTRPPQAPAGRAQRAAGERRRAPARTSSSAADPGRGAR